MPASRDESLPGDATAPADQRPPVVLLADLEPALQLLLQTWLGEIGARSAPADAPPPDAPALLLVGLPYPREYPGEGGSPRLQALRAAWPGVPAIALSPTLLTSVAAQGEVAQRLGVQAVLPAPLARESLLGAVRALLGPPR
ncbi:MAG: hypothetical protein KF788_20260 [Piscinibacter sp.]|nr:hypothetical protein [Piscinibacter sp.]